MNSAVATVNAQTLIPHARWIRIIPPAIIVYIIAFMDRMNIGFAMAGGMNEALGISMASSGLAAGMFFIGYLLLQAPAGHIAEHRSAKNYIACTIVAWGGISVLTGFVHNFWQLIVLRLLLGVAEGGIYPAIFVIVGNWFPQKELGRANGLFLCSLPLSAVLTNPVSGWIITHYGWRWLFFAEGAVSLGLIFIWWPLISDRPTEAKWLSEEEKAYLLAALAADKVAKAAAIKTSEQVNCSYRQLCADKYLWLMTTIFFCFCTASLGYAIWLPTLLKQLMKLNLTYVGWLTSLPFLMSLTGLYLMGALSDRKGNRRFYIALSMIGFCVCLWFATLFPSHIWLTYGLLVFAGLTQKSMQSPFWAVPSLLFPPGVAGAARGLINGVGNLGSFCGSVLVGWIMTKTGNMTHAMYALAAVSMLGGVITILLPKITTGYKQTMEVKAR
jgi:MFS family permease